MNLKKLYQVDIPNTVNFKETSQICGDIGDQPNQPTRGAHLFIDTKMKFQTIQGLGGAFSELGGKAILSLNNEKQDEVGKSLFKDKFNFYRLPIGASDFALDAYSLDDVKDDFEMEHFSLQRDEKYLIPYMKIAKKFCENMKLHASPWCPPAWLKQSGLTGKGGRLIDDDIHHKAHAKYFRRTIEEYKKKNFDIVRLNVQNEPEVTPEYPSCTIPPEDMSKLIKNYIYPEFKQHNIDTEIFAGTYRGVWSAAACDLLAYDDDIKNYIDGIGFQYTSMQQINDIRANYPQLKLMHTESNCFRGENTWEQAIVLYINIVNYMAAGCDTYTYWNMILNTIGTSSWGWKQNSLITIDEENNSYIFNPDYFIMTLASYCLKPNSKRVVYYSFNKVGFAVENEDGSVTFMVSNFSDREEVGTVTIDGTPIDITLEPMSIATFKIEK